MMIYYGVCAEKKLHIAVNFIVLFVSWILCSFDAAWL